MHSDTKSEHPLLRVLLRL